MRYNILALFFLFPGLALTQSLDEIIAGHQQACGGIKNWGKITSLVIEGEYRSFSEPGSFRIERLRPDFYRFHHQLLKANVTWAFDGERPWMINPLYGDTLAKRFPDADSLIVLREKSFEPIFWDYRQKGISVTLNKEADIDGVDCFHLTVQLADSVREHWYLDKSTFLPLKLESRTFDFGREVMLETYFSEYRRVGDIVLPYLIEQEFDIRYRIFNVKNVMINQPATAADFAMPPMLPGKEE